MYLPNTAVTYIHTTALCCVVYGHTHTQPFMQFRRMIFLQKACSFFFNGDIYFRNFMVGGHPQGMKESPQKKWLSSVKPLLSDAQASE